MSESRLLDMFDTFFSGGIVYCGALPFGINSSGWGEYRAKDGLETSDFK